MSLADKKFRVTGNHISSNTNVGEIVRPVKESSGVYCKTEDGATYYFAPEELEIIEEKTEDVKEPVPASTYSSTDALENILNSGRIKNIEFK